MAGSIEDQPGVDEIGHTHADVSGGWLRASVFGAMDGLVTNTSLVAGVGGAGASSRVVILTGMAGLVAGAFSMALGEFTSVQTQNEQVEREFEIERQEINDNPVGEQRELAAMFEEMGMSSETAAAAARDIHGDAKRAALVHLTHELGIDPRENPSPRVAAVSSFLTFSVGSLIPLIPYLLGFTSLALGLLAGGLGLLGAGALASRFTAQPWWRSALRQLLFGCIATGATFAVGSLIGVEASG